MENLNKQRLTIRISRNTLSFAVLNAEDKENPLSYEPYTVKSGISIAANLREAFKDSELLNKGYRRVQALIDAPVLLIPVDLFKENEIDDLYNHSFIHKETDVLAYNVLPSLNAVAVFAVNKDLKLVLDDHFDDVKMICISSPVWKHLHQRSFMGQHNKLFGFFHDKKLEIFSFSQNRFKFCNTFETNRAHDALYFLLYVWKQLMLRPEQDEMHIVGDIPEKDWLINELRKYLQRAYCINPSAEFNRSPITQVRGIQYDMITLLLKGR